MDIRNMVELVNMIKSLDTKLEDGTQKWIYDWVFCEDGKSIYVELCDHSIFEFRIG